VHRENGGLPVSPDWVYNSSAELIWDRLICISLYYLGIT
jgi:hypothetical protein